MTESDPPPADTLDLEDPPTVDWPWLLRRACAAYFVMWLGITLAGTLFGAFFFLIGAIVGFILAGIAGGVTSLLGVALHVMMRGRLPLRTSASFAGATAGVFSWGVLGFEQGVMRLPPESPAFWLITAPLGSLGAVIATSLLLRAFDWRDLGRPLRRGQFSLADMMLLTAWAAIVMTSCRLLVAPAPAGSYRDAMIAVVTLVAMLLTEWLYRVRRSRRAARTNRGDEAAIRAFWQRHDEHMEAIARGDGDSLSVPRETEGGNRR